MTSQESVTPNSDAGGKLEFATRGFDFDLAEVDKLQAADMFEDGV